MKRFLIIPLLALIGTVGAIAHDFEQDGIYYLIDTYDPLFPYPTVSVTHQSVTFGSYSGDVVVPATVTYEGQQYIVRHVEEQAFCQSTQLKSVTLPWTIRRLYDKAFAYCTGLETITMLNLDPAWLYVDDEVFKDVNLSGVTLRVPYTMESEYSQYSPWKTFGQIETMAYVFSQKDVNGNEICYIIEDDEDVAVANNFDGPYTIGEFSTYSGDVVIPAHVTYQGVTFNVTEIDCNAFFYCSDLHSVKLPYTIDYIDHGAFQNCESLQDIYLPNEVYFIGKKAFSDCRGLTKLEFGREIYNINPQAFQYCSHLESLTFRNAAHCSIYEDAFKSLPLNEMKVYNPDPSDIYISSIDAFTYTDLELATLYVPQGTASDYSDTGLWYYFGNIVEMGTTVDYDFAEANAGRDIYYSINPDGTSVSVTFKSKTAASYIGNIVIPSTVTHDGTTYDVTAIAPYAFYYKNTSLKSVTIPNSVTTIGERAFSGTSINSVSIGSGVTTIGEKAFLGCNFLTELTLPASLKEIGTGAFTSCSRLKSLVIPDGVVYIGDEAFYGAIGLEELTIGESVRSIGAKAFAGLGALKNIYMESYTPDYMDMGEGVFEDCAVETVALNLPKGGKVLYRTAPQWRDFLNMHEDGEVALGDVNGDGKLNSADITYIVQHLLDNTPDGFNATAADANEDGKINSADITAIIVKILNIQ